MNLPSPQDRKAMQARYAPPKAPIIKWTVVQLGKVVYEGSAGLCQSYIDKNGLVNAVKKAVYGNK